jgi:hypothetical protein
VNDAIAIPLEFSAEFRTRLGMAAAARARIVRSESSERFV